MDHQNEGPPQAVPFVEYLTIEYRWGIAGRLMTEVRRIIGFTGPDQFLWDIILQYECNTYVHSGSKREYLQQLSLKILELKARTCSPAAFRGVPPPQLSPAASRRLLCCPAIGPPPPPNPAAYTGQFGPLPNHPPPPPPNPAAYIGQFGPLPIRPPPPNPAAYRGQYVPPLPGPSPPNPAAYRGQYVPPPPGAPPPNPAAYRGQYVPPPPNPAADSG